MGRFVLKQETNAYQVEPETAWRGFRASPSVPYGPELGTWGAPAPVLDALAQYNADREMGLSSAVAASALERVASSGLEAALARLSAHIIAREGRDTQPGLA